MLHPVCRDGYGPQTPTQGIALNNPDPYRVSVANNPNNAKAHCQNIHIRRMASPNDTVPYTYIPDWKPVLPPNPSS